MRSKGTRLAAHEGCPGGNEGAPGPVAGSLDEPLVRGTVDREHSLDADCVDLAVEIRAMDVRGAVVVCHRAALLSVGGRWCVVVGGWSLVVGGW